MNNEGLCYILHLAKNTSVIWRNAHGGQDSVLTVEREDYKAKHKNKSGTAHGGQDGVLTSMRFARKCRLNKRLKQYLYTQLSSHPPPLHPIFATFPIKKATSTCIPKKILLLLHSQNGNNGSLAQLNRAFDYGSKGYRFESYRSHKNKSSRLHGSLAQLNRASDYGSEGYRFESYRSHFKQKTGKTRNATAP